MSNYTVTTNFGAKDDLASGNAGKIIKGAEFTTEFNNIATAVATKADTASPTFTGTVTIPTITLGGVTVTSTATELNLLDGVTASTAELNLLDGVTATTAELNYVDGVTSNIQTQLDAKGTVSSLSDLSVTATAAELNKLDGVTATTAELNLVDGLTAIPDYVTGTFTPVVADAVSGGNTATMNSAQGRYTKVGRMVHVTIQLLNINTTGMTSSSQLYVRDLPFTAYDNDDEMKWVGSLFSAGVATADAAHGPWVPVISDNNDWLSFLGTLNSSSTIPDSLKVSDILTNGADIFLSISYEAA